MGNDSLFGDYMYKKDKLNRCIEICNRLKKEISEDSYIPETKFSGQTADVLIHLRIKHMETIQSIINELSVLANLPD